SRRRDGPDERGGTRRRRGRRRRGDRGPYGGHGGGMTGARTSDAAARPAAQDRVDARSVLRGVALPWLVSRVLSVVPDLVAAPAVAGRSRFTNLLTAYDAGHYLAIARLGYGPLGVFQPRWAFFPGLPGVIRGLDTFMDGRLGVFVVNQLGFLVALAGVHVI